MATNENKMWVVKTATGIAYIGRDPKKDSKATADAQKGKYLDWATASLGYPVIFKNIADGRKFAKLASDTGYPAVVIEVEFYKGEMEAD